MPVVRPGTVLVVEGSPDVRASLRSQLSSAGHRVLEADTRDGALSTAREQRPDVILLDLDAPGVDGLDVLREAAADPAVHDVPVVLVTGRTNAELLARAVALGATDYLVTPHDEAELLVRVNAAVRLKEVRDELGRREQELAEAAQVDPVTGLYNRRHLDERLEALCSGARRHKQPVGMLMIDLDNFKAVNDRLGHAAGDAVCRQVGARLRDSLRAEDLVGRWDGAGFLVLLPGTDFVGALALAERLRDGVAREPFPTGQGGPVAVTVSVGCTTTHGDDPEDLIRRADAALRSAKQGGRDRVAYL